MKDSDVKGSIADQIKYSNGKNYKKGFDLEKRTFIYATNVIEFTEIVQRNIINNEILKQIIRSSGSIGANYIVANESLSKKNFLMHIKICRKESKETAYWLKLLNLNNTNYQTKCEPLIDEAIQLKKIFSSIVEKSS